MILFWVVAGLLAAVAAALLLSRAARAAQSGAVGDPASAVYMRQLAEIDELAERGLIAETERKGAHAEAARRLLVAADDTQAPWAVGPADRKAILIAAVAAPAAALALYMAVGFPGLADQGFGKRLAEWRATDPQTLGPEQMAAVLQDVLRERPNDVEGLRYLALAQGAADKPGEAIRALRRAITLAPDRADLWEMLGKALAYENDGVVGPNAQIAFRRALELDPSLDGPRQALATDTQAPPPLDAIRGMVASLAAKLEAEPDDADGWVRLVRSYAVLGETDKRDAALKSARARFAGQPKVQAELTTAAAAARMIP